MKIPKFVIVSPSKFNNDAGILFRRNKFANYLLENDFKVIWIYKNVIRPWNENHYRGCIKDLDESLQKIDSDSSDSDKMRVIRIDLSDDEPETLKILGVPWYIFFPLFYLRNKQNLPLIVKVNNQISKKDEDFVTL